MVRCFLGILVPEKIKDKIKLVKNELKNLPMKCKFVEDENLHVCLSFLGEINEENVKIISEKIDEISKKFESFDVEVDGIKMIPNERYIRVLALDVLDKGDVLNKLSKDIQVEIGGSVKPPHLTLCRVKTITDKPSVIKKIKEMNKNIGSFTVDRLQLIKSELRKNGPLYSVIHEGKFSLS